MESRYVEKMLLIENRSSGWKEFPQLMGQYGGLFQVFERDKIDG
jgi:hypothetical protein